MCGQRRWPAPSDSGGVYAAFGLNLLGGKLTVLAFSHFGPENPTRTVPDANGRFRYENDIVVTYKATDALTLTTELNLIRDDAFHANGFGGAQYVSYALNDWVTLNGRMEVWRDDNGFFVAAFPQNLGFVNSELGLPPGLFRRRPPPMARSRWAPPSSPACRRRSRR